MVTVQVAKAETQRSSRSFARSDSLSREPGGHHAEGRRAGKDVLCQSWQPRARGQLLAVLENRDLAAAEVENKGAYQQAQANYGIETSSALPEEWQKAEYDLKTAKEAYDAQQKVYDSRQMLFEEGALPRKDFDASAVALARQSRNTKSPPSTWRHCRSAGKKEQLKSAEGQLTSAQGKYEGAAAQLAYSEIRSPIDGVVTDRPTYPGETPPAGTPLLTVMDTSSVIAQARTFRRTRRRSEAW